MTPTQTLRLTSWLALVLLPLLALVVAAAGFLPNLITVVLLAAGPAGFAGCRIAARRTARRTA